MLERHGAAPWVVDVASDTIEPFAVDVGFWTFLAAGPAGLTA